MNLLSIKSISILVVLTIVYACSSKKEETSTTNQKTTLSSNTIQLSDEQIKILVIKTGTITEKSIGNIITASGILDVPPQNNVSITAKMAGFVKHTSLLPGMLVKKGDVLAVLENQEFIQLQQDYLDIQSQLEYAEEEYKRQQSLSKENVNAQKVVQQAKSNYVSLKAKYDGLKAKLNFVGISLSDVNKGNFQSSITLVAPINGYVTKVNVNTGAFVNTSDVLFKLVDNEHMHAELNVFDKDIPAIKINQQVLIQLANQTEQLHAKVHLIGKEISTERSIGVHCDLEEHNHNLLPGTYVTAQIETDERIRHVVPEKAIVQFEGNNYVFTANANKTYELTPVTIGANSMGFTELISYTELLNKQIVTEGAYELLGALKNTAEE